ncbi:MAG: glycosyltransferase family 4 protein [Bacilli bacterium]|nr:glycosyltransferase family 4 protein [Bacilli bacterium]MDD4076484.1 glycosyltransferase family 4 protein [Bacilli bacterium]MDD4387765.1 glycosyltransferase family 4 protein [Bacilli bacterium]
MKKIVLNCNDCFAAYKFRLDLIKKLKEEYQVYVVAGFDDHTQFLKRENIDVYIIDIDKTGTGIFKEIKLFFTYRKIFKKLKPDIIINYTIKPHLYATMAAPKNTKIINVVTGLSSIFTKNTIITRVVILLYRLISKKINHYVFLNIDDYHYFVGLKILKKSHTIIKGEGVNLDNFYPYVDLSMPLTFIFIGRLVKEKGIIEYLEAAKLIKNRFSDVRFLIAGSFYKKNTMIDRELIRCYEKEGIVNYLGYCYDINEILRKVHCVVLPSYREGLPISLIEGLASKKIIIAANAVGSKDVVVDGFNGFLANIKSSYDLAVKMEKYIFARNKEEMHNNALYSSRQYDVNNAITAMKRIIEGI